MDDKVKRFKTISVREERDRCLFDAYNEALNSMRFETQSEIYDHVRKMPAPKFFIEAETCAIYIGRLLRKKDPGICNETSKRRMSELYIRYQEESKKKENKGLSVVDICQIIINQPAPEFYLEVSSVENIIEKERRNKWEVLKRKS